MGCNWYANWIKAIIGKEVALSEPPASIWLSLASKSMFERWSWPEVFSFTEATSNAILPPSAGLQPALLLLNLPLVATAFDALSPSANSSGLLKPKASKAD